MVVCCATQPLEAAAPNTQLSTGRWVDVGELLERCLGNRELAGKVLGRFQSSLKASVFNIAAMAQSGDLTAVVMAAHRLRGEAGNVGCGPIREAAELVEELAGQRLHDGVMLAVDQLVGLSRDFPIACDLIAE